MEDFEFAFGVRYINMPHCSTHCNTHNNTLQHTATHCISRCDTTYKRDPHTPKETYETDQPKRRTKKIWHAKRDLQKRPTKKNNNRDQQNRPTNQTHKSDPQIRPTNRSTDPQCDRPLTFENNKKPVHAKRKPQ